MTQPTTSYEIPEAPASAVNITAPKTARAETFGEHERHQLPTRFRLPASHVADLRLVFGDAEARAGFKTTFATQLLVDAAVARGARGVLDLDMGTREVHLFEAESWCDSMQVRGASGPSSHYHRCREAIRRMADRPGGSRHAIVLHRAYGPPDPFFFARITVPSDTPFSPDEAKREPKEERCDVRWPELRHIDSEALPLVLMTPSLVEARERFVAAEVRMHVARSRDVAEKSDAAIELEVAPTKSRHALIQQHLRRKLSRVPPAPESGLDLAAIAKRDTWRLGVGDLARREAEARARVSSVSYGRRMGLVRAHAEAEILRGVDNAWTPQRTLEHLLGVHVRCPAEGESDAAYRARRTEETAARVSFAVQAGKEAEALLVQASVAYRACWWKAGA